MSIGAALSNAYSGLSAASRMASVISSNVANSLNEDYSRRSVALSADSVARTGAGVRIDGVTRFEDSTAVAASRRSGAESGSASLLASALLRMETALGLPENSGSLAGRAIALETALVAASANPDSTSALTGVLSAATNLTRNLTAISTENQRIRMDADADIAQKVEIVNQSLADIARLNREIQMQSVSGDDTGALMDQRKALIDKVAGIIPIRSVPRDGNQVALFSTSGAQLLDGPPSRLGFAAAGTITSDMSLAGGTLSGLTLNGNPIAIGNGSGLLDGGSLAASFTIRDVLVPQADAKLDAFATDLIARFESPAIDPGITSGLPGLFSDAGAALDLLQTQGLAGRIAVNAAADPAQGGALWHLRDGLYAAAEGDAGNSAVLAPMRAAVSIARTPPAALATSRQFSLAGLAAEVVSQNATAAQAANERAAYHSAQAAAFREAELARAGVDTDYEMQQLMLVEQAYAANARVISVVDNLLRRLMEM